MALTVPVKGCFGNGPTAGESRMALPASRALSIWVLFLWLQMVQVRAINCPDSGESLVARASWRELEKGLWTSVRRQYRLYSLDDCRR